MEKRAEAVAIRSHDFGKTGGSTFAKIDTEHAPDTLCRERNFRAPAFRHEAFGERLRGLLDPCDETGLRHELERSKTRRDGDRVSRQGPGLIDRTERGDFFHDLAPAAERTHRHASADDLAKRGQIRTDAVAFLCAA